MKNILYKTTTFLFAAFLCATVFWMGCDKIDDPYTVIGQSIEEGEMRETEPISGEAVKHVLLEDYTGIQCVNCPKAAKTAHDLEAAADGKIIILSVHAGYNARPGDPPLDVDLTTPEGEEYLLHYEITANPVGLINRKKKNTGVHYFMEREWETQTDAEMEVAPTMKMEISEVSLEGKTLKAKVKYENVADLPEDHKLVVFLVEDGIVTGQKNSNVEVGPTPLIEAYTHHNTLRGSLTGAWGLPISAKVTGDIFSRKFTHEIQTERFEGTTYKLIAFIYNVQTEYIEQVIEYQLP